jgi:hypothetical protein
MSISLQASQIQINGIEDVSDGNALIIFGENFLVEGRPKERCLSERLREHGYDVVLGEAVGSTAFRTLIVSKPGGGLLKAGIYALLESDKNAFLLNPAIHV